MSLDPAAFAYDVPAPPPPPLDGDGLAARTIAPGPHGWVIGGGYSANFPEDGAPMQTEDAVAWFSPDGRDWRRVDTPEIFGGDGYQRINHVAGDASGWWALGESWTGTPDDVAVARPMWRSEDGVEWRRVEIEADVQALARSWPPVGSGVAAGGRSGGKLAFFRLDDEGNVSESASLPIPTWVEDPATVEVGGISFGANGWFVLGWELVPGHTGPERRSLGWTSSTGRAWEPLDEGATSRLADLFPRSVVATPHGWIAVSEYLYRSGDLSTWDRVAEMCCGNAFDEVVVHGDLLVALSDDKIGVWTSLDGLAWSPVALTDPMFQDDELSSGARPHAGASNGAELILAGRDWPGAAAWLGVTP